MNERERWIVYPLLFLALGASLRDKLFNRTQTKTIVCESLSVEGPDQPPIPVLYTASTKANSPFKNLVILHADQMSVNQIVTDHVQASVIRGKELDVEFLRINDKELISIKQLLASLIPRPRAVKAPPKLPLKPNQKKNGKAAPKQPASTP